MRKGIKVSLKQIAAQWLSDNDFDGFHRLDSCYCDRADLMHAERCSGRCMPGFKIADPMGVGDDYLIVAELRRGERRIR